MASKSVLIELKMLPLVLAELTSRCLGTAAYYLVEDWNVGESVLENLMAWGRFDILKKRYLQLRGDLFCFVAFCKPAQQFIWQ